MKLSRSHRAVARTHLHWAADGVRTAIPYLTKPVIPPGPKATVGFERHGVTVPRSHRTVVHAHVDRAQRTDPPSPKTAIGLDEGGLVITCRQPLDLPQCHTRIRRLRQLETEVLGAEARSGGNLGAVSSQLQDDAGAGLHMEGASGAGVALLAFHAAPALHTGAAGGFGLQGHGAVRGQADHGLRAS